MTLPTTLIPTTNLDSLTDNPGAALDDLLATVQSLNAIIEMLGQPGGVALLNTDGQLDSAAYSGEGVLQALNSVDGPTALDADKLDSREGSEYALRDMTRAVSGFDDATPGQVFERLISGANNVRVRAISLHTLALPGAGATGLGTELRARLNNSAGVLTDAGSLAWDWISATAAAEASDMIGYVTVGGALSEAFRWKSTGALEVAEIATPAGNAPTGKWWLYPTSAGWAVKGDTGAEVLLSTGAGTTDHHVLTNRNLDDHPQYLLVSGTRPMSGMFQTGSFPILFTDVPGDPLAPSAGAVKVYSKAGELYYRNATAIVGPLGAGGGGSGDHHLLTHLDYDDHPQYLLRDPATDVVLNSGAADIDWTWKTPGRPSMLVIDAALGYIGVNMTPLAGNGVMQISTTFAENALRVEGSASSPVLLVNKTGTAATNGGLWVVNTSLGRSARIDRQAGAAASVPVLEVRDLLTFGADVVLQVSNASVGKGVALFQTTLGSALAVAAGEVVINDAGAAYNFRVEGDTATQLLNVIASSDVVNVNGALTAARFNVTGGSLDGIYALSTTSAKFAAFFEHRAIGWAARFLGGSLAGGRGGGFIVETKRDQCAAFSKNLGAESVSAAYAVTMSVDDVDDTAHVLMLGNIGTGDYLRLVGPFDEILGEPYPLRVPSTGGLFMQDLTVDMPAAASGYHGLYFKTDGLYVRTPTGVIGPIGAGGGVVVGAHWKREPAVIEEVLTLTSGARVAMMLKAPAGCQVEFVRVMVLTDVAGGLHVGVDGAETRFAESMVGTALETNELFANQPMPFSVGASDMEVVATSPGGSFSGGTVHISIFVVRCDALP